MNGESAAFVDTNILVYAYDADAGKKREIARDLLARLWSTREGTLSTQVLQEFYVTVTRKLPHPLDHPTARRVIDTYRTWPVQPIDVAAILAASRVEDRWHLSFWDALIVTAAKQSGAGRIFSEDLQAGQVVDGIVIENPFVV
jgi:predicted nucleic acid-binding protein